MPLPCSTDATLVEGGHLHEGGVAAQLGIRGRPAVAEEIVVARDLALARLAGAHYHVLHTSAAATLELVRRAKADGVGVTAEVTPQHLCLTDAALLGGDARFKMNPPLRSDEHRAALRAGLAEGVIDAIATDHAPHPDDRKAQSLELAPPGMTGLETMLASVLTHLVGEGVVPLDRVLDAVTTQPARIAGLADHGAPVAAGTRANLAVIDPTATWVVDPDALGSKSHNNPFAGTELVGRVRHTLLAGDPVVIDAVAQL